MQLVMLARDFPLDGWAENSDNLTHLLVKSTGYRMLTLNNINDYHDMDYFEAVVPQQVLSSFLSITLILWGRFELQQKYFHYHYHLI